MVLADALHRYLDPDDGTATIPTVEGKTKVKLGVALAAFVILLTFILLNMEAIEVNVIVGKITMRRSLLLITTYAIGFFSGWALHSIASSKKARS